MEEFILGFGKYWGFGGFFNDVLKEMLSFPNTVFPRVALTYPSTHGEECFSEEWGGREEYKELLIAIWRCCNHWEVTLAGCRVSMHSFLPPACTKWWLRTCGRSSTQQPLNSSQQILWFVLLCKTSVICCQTHNTPGFGGFYVIPNCSHTWYFRLAF